MHARESLKELEDEWTPSSTSDEDALADAESESESSYGPQLGKHTGTRPRKWLAEENDRLKDAVASIGEAHWKAIALRVRTRNHVQCLQRWTKALKPGLVKGLWSPEENARLEELVERDFLNWGRLAVHMPGRTSKQCRERWCHHLDPSIKKARYSDEEDKTIVALQRRYGNRWSQIAATLPGRTENAIKIRWKIIQRQLRHCGGSERGNSSGNRTMALVAEPGSNRRACSSSLGFWSSASYNLSDSPGSSSSSSDASALSSKESRTSSSRPGISELAFGLGAAEAATLYGPQQSRPQKHTSVNSEAAAQQKPFDWYSSGSLVAALYGCNSGGESGGENKNNQAVQAVKAMSTVALNPAAAVGSSSTSWERRRANLIDHPLPQSQQKEQQQSKGSNNACVPQQAVDTPVSAAYFNDVAAVPPMLSSSAGVSVACSGISDALAMEWLPEVVLDAQLPPRTTSLNELLMLNELNPLRIAFDDGDDSLLEGASVW